MALFHSYYINCKYLQFKKYLHNLKFSPIIPLRIKAKQFLVSSDQMILFITILESFRCFFSPFVLN